MELEKIRHETAANSRRIKRAVHHINFFSHKMFTNSQYLHLLKFLNANEPSFQLTEKQILRQSAKLITMYTNLIKATILIKTSVIRVFGDLGTFY